MALKLAMGRSLRLICDLQIISKSIYCFTMANWSSFALYTHPSIHVLYLTLAENGDFYLAPLINILQLVHTL